MTRPQPFDSPSELWLARIRADELRDAWKSANSSTARNTAAMNHRRSRVRTETGRVFVWLGKLISGDAAVRMEQPARRTQPGC